MTAQLTHETRLTSIALSTTSFPIIWCAGHFPAQNNDCHMFYQKLFLSINNGPVIVTGIPIHGMRSKTSTLKLRLTFAVKESNLTLISYHCG